MEKMNHLKKYLLINSGFSAVSGLGMLLFSATLNGFFNLQNPYIFPFIGLNLLVFALIVGYVAQRHLHQKRVVSTISLLDGLWVLGSLVIVSFQLFDLSQGGYIAIALVAVWIGFLGFNQYKFNRN